MKLTNLLRQLLFLILTLIFSLGFHSCESKTSKDTSSKELVSLKEAYKDYFPIGVAVSPFSLKDSIERALILEQFSSMTPENVMKSGPIHPEIDRYNWRAADEIANFARDNGLKLRGHALIWHQQYPEWFFKDQQGNQITKDTLYARMRSHIHTVVKRYKDVIYAWDVVNEAVADSTHMVYRESSPFYQIAGEEYLVKAFEFAKEADPDAKLYYNDYNAVRPEKAKRIHQLLENLIQSGAPIDGVGIQGHWSIYEPSETALRNALDLYSSLDLEIQITELDISIFPWEKHQRPLKEGENKGFTPELEQKQIAQYQMIFEVFRDYKDALTGVTFWNISDRYSWLDHYPVEGRKNYPLLFDTELQPKKVYHKIVNFNQE